MVTAKIKCPNCGFEERVKIPENKCLLYYKCKNCGKLVSTPRGSCCIICSYSDKKCLMES